MHRLFRNWRKSKDETDRQAYSQAKKVAKTVTAKAQESAKKELGDMLDKAEGRGQIFRAAKQIVQKNKDVVGGGCVKDKSGKLITEESRIRGI
jgi:membrane carboxypeptidase/penicillin-binding protein